MKRRIEYDSAYLMHARDKLDRLMITAWLAIVCVGTVALACGIFFILSFL